MLDGNEKESHSRATQADLSGAYNSLTLPAGGSLTSDPVISLSSQAARPDTAHAGLAAAAAAG
ncbi:hypothetical protein PCANC_09824 [Puccinia coronata f. sp. avenae]|uniref:Uncharacterized protein n=1 Tax=Puccinia coronata f. sp. avenae TaxID=200324 RepID=A0A2N5T0L5_9BASI|nr:hypothetical protein PCANC_09824 [Puccinia coronata f. sp. avenae]